MAVDPRGEPRFPALREFFGQIQGRRPAEPDYEIGLNDESRVV
jgi:hypothetical protein